MKRPIQAIFYKHGKVVKTNNSSHANYGVVNAIKHMQTNQYNAQICEVFNTKTGKLYAVLKWTKVGTALTVLYRAVIEEFNHGD